MERQNTGRKARFKSKENKERTIEDGLNDRLVIRVSSAQVDLCRDIVGGTILRKYARVEDDLSSCKEGQNMGNGMLVNS